MWAVVHYKDGRVLKGFTRDFAPTKKHFHLTSEDDKGRGTEHRVDMKTLKAVFFVKSLNGNKEYDEKKRFEEVQGSKLKGLKIMVKFSDGEIIRGITLGYSKYGRGFFVIPVDPESNNERIYVVADGDYDVKIGAAAEK
ncbi:MAG: hypothetical protein IBX68_10115 [Dehalococcoidia bacterium]|nr:hypothetical protein [Dehalococcoidia bacterium]